jgi:hypothetical protein
MSEFTNLEKEHLELAEKLVEGKIPDPAVIYPFLEKAVGASRGIRCIEDRHELRGILRFWAGHLVMEGHPFPDIDINTPERVPEHLETKEIGVNRRYHETLATACSNAGSEDFAENYQKLKILISELRDQMAASRIDLARALGVRNISTDSPAQRRSSKTPQRFLPVRARRNRSNG